jgi:predicted RNA-binding protein with PUA-like domain
MAHWLVKTEPDTYAWADLVRDGHGRWDGVRNHSAKLNLMAMRLGDEVIVYHSVADKAAVGVARVVREHFPDPTAEVPAGKPNPWVCVEIEPVRPFAQPVPLAAFKAQYGTGQPLGRVEMLRQNRLSVVPLRPGEFAEVLRLGGA